MPISVVILAAGAGTRMKSQTPKVLHKICGKEMIYYVIKEAQKVSADVNVVLYHKYDEVRDVIRKYFGDTVGIYKQDHGRFPGTGGAMFGVETKYDKILVLNGDMPLVDKESIEGFQQCEGDIVMSVMELKSGTGYGRVVIKEGFVERIVEEKDADESIKKINTVNAGVYLFSKKILDRYLPKLSNDNAQKEYYLTDIVAMYAKEEGKIVPLFVDETSFKGVNSKLDLSNAEAMMCRRIKERFMLQGVIMHLPETIYIEEGVELIGECEVESGVVIKSGSKITESHIKSGSVIEESTIINSEVGPYARVRPGCEIVDSKIGNFVELKKAKLEDVKAGHLSYLGDCEIGSGTNIGAGTITCNYDGVKKYKTVIGKDVFVGSDTQLIAPIIIEDKTIIAAGTTVTKDTKTGSLVISRVKQGEIAGYYYKHFGEKG